MGEGAFGGRRDSRHPDCRLRSCAHRPQGGAAPADHRRPVSGCGRRPCGR
jgi:hypothetical protein